MSGEQGDDLYMRCCELANACIDHPDWVLPSRISSLTRWVVAECILKRRSDPSPQNVEWLEQLRSYLYEGGPDNDFSKGEGFESKLKDVY